MRLKTRGCSNTKRKSTLAELAGKHHLDPDPEINRRLWVSGEIWREIETNTFQFSDLTAQNLMAPKVDDLSVHARMEEYFQKRILQRHDFEKTRAVLSHVISGHDKAVLTRVILQGLSISQTAQEVLGTCKKLDKCRILERLRCALWHIANVLKVSRYPL